MSKIEAVPYTAVINSGGLATRAPKSMAPLGEHGEVLKALAMVGEPPTTLVDHHISYHLGNGAANVIANVGPHKRVAHHVDANYDGRDTVQSFRVERASGTGGDLLRLVKHSEIIGRLCSLIVITNVDTIADVDVQALIHFHTQAGNKLTLTVTEQSAVPDQGIYFVGQHDQIVYSQAARFSSINENDADKFTAYRTSSTGVVVADTAYVQELFWSPLEGSLSLERDIFAGAIDEGVIGAYNNGNRFFLDLGTVERWQEAQDSERLQPYLCY